MRKQARAQRKELFASKKGTETVHQKFTGKTFETQLKEEKKLRVCSKKLRKIQQKKEKQEKTLLKCQRSQMSFKGSSGGSWAGLQGQDGLQR